MSSLSPDIWPLLCRTLLLLNSDPIQLIVCSTPGLCGQGYPAPDRRKKRTRSPRSEDLIGFGQHGRSRGPPLYQELRTVIPKQYLHCGRSLLVVSLERISSHHSFLLFYRLVFRRLLRRLQSISRRSAKSSNVLQQLPTVTYIDSNT